MSEMSQAEKLQQARIEHLQTNAEERKAFLDRMVPLLINAFEDAYVRNETSFALQESCDAGLLTELNTLVSSRLAADGWNLIELQPVAVNLFNRLGLIWTIPPNQ